MHAIRAAVSMPLSRIFTTYQVTDNCIPLTAFYRFLLDRGVALPEMALRLPIVLSGLLLLIAVPAFLVDRIGRRAALFLAWLLALSPILALYSGILRSYMPVALLGSLAVLAFESWWRTGRSRSAAGYVVAAALAVWFHLGATPLVAAPFLFALGDLAVREDRGRRLRRLLLLAAAVAGSIALLIAPAAPSLLQLIATKHGHQPIPGRTLLAVLSLQAGTARPLLIALFWLATLCGFLLLLRRDRRLGVYTLCLVGGQLLGILLLSPIGLPHPLIFDRYLIPILPVLLLWTAVALAYLSERFAAVGWGLAAFFLLALAVSGPFADPHFRASSFRLSNDFVGFYQPRATLPPEAVPAFYRRLGAARDGGAVL
ncbi:MAG TPA: hypothetical protein VOA87_02475, partial [Thermoanaerobaculia bacterium]|nr:hypothetical protein [Thermoanaerobaculia bacterium]